MNKALAEFRKKHLPKELHGLQNEESFERLAKLHKPGRHEVFRPLIEDRYLELLQEKPNSLDTLKLLQRLYQDQNLHGPFSSHIYASYEDALHFYLKNVTDPQEIEKLYENCPDELKHLFFII